MLVVMAVACVEPPLLDRVATAYGQAVVDSSTTPVGLFVSVAALVAEPCAAETLEDYTLVGEAHHAFRVTSPSVTISESGERTYAYGIVAFEGDVGELTLTSDAARHAWTARYTGEQGSFLANYAVSECEVDEAGVTVLARVAGSGSYTLAEGSAQDIAVTGGSESTLSWAPSTATLPTSGAVNWTDLQRTETLQLDDAVTINLVDREWPGVATGGTWTTAVTVPLP